MLDQIRVVLVNTSHPGNIGGAARALKNMGLTDLVLVQPKDFPSSEAVARASGADDLLASAKVVEFLEEAIADCQIVIGASARTRHIPWPLLSSREAGEKAVEAAAGENRVALVFGREATGLTNSELALCTAHLHIPANPEYSSLNLVTAVQVVTYEVRMAFLQTQMSETPEAGRWGVAWDHPLAEQAELEGLFQHLENTLVAIKFLDPENPKQLMPRLRRLFQRASPDKTEVNILRGVLKMVDRSRKS